MQVGHAEIDITPSVGVTLSGFVARRNRPSTGVDDPLSLHALALRDGPRRALLLIYDLLALGPELTDRLARAAADATAIPAQEVILCCTHTHSAPAAITLLGCGVCDGRYWDSLAGKTAHVARQAVADLADSRIRHSVRHIPGVQYNRRLVLADGRVVMTARPGASIVRTGPTHDRCVLALVEDLVGRPRIGLAQFAGHALVVCTDKISADWPGELRRRLTQQYGVPFVFLGGASGDLNLPFSQMTRPEMLADVDLLTSRLGRAEWSAPESLGPLRRASAEASLVYQPPPGESELQVFRDGMRQVAATACGPEDTVAVLANILNVEPGQDPPAEMMKYVAGVLADWSEGLLLRRRDLRLGVSLRLEVLALGRLILAIMAAEPFVETALAVERVDDRTIMLVGYGSPLVGYLPTDQAMDEGGYETQCAYRFYNHPAPFAKGSEAAVRQRLIELVRQVAGA